MEKKVSRKRKAVDTPICKYGDSCYQKNPEHRKKFKHPPAEEKVSKKQDINRNSLAKAAEEDIPESSKTRVNENRIDESVQNLSSENLCCPDENKNTCTTATDSGEIVDKILITMPKDFFDFWDFCNRLNRLKPEDAFWKFGFKLVGVYDLLAKKLPPEQKVNISCHWRYYYDPPEFQTVIKKKDEKMFHIGYFRDDPSEMPSIVASNCAAVDSMLKLEGDNIFAAMNTALSNAAKSMKSKNMKTDAQKILDKLEECARKKNYSLHVQTDKTKERQKKVVAKTFHGLGIVVPVKNDVGYRPLPESNDNLKKVLNKIVSAKTEDERLNCEEALDEIISNVNFANDECDYGMGLELGIDLFCFGDALLNNYILSVLPLAYRLLHRSKFAEVLEEHLKNRKKGANVYVPLFI